MNFSNTLQTDVLDILFANRNKSYGAYQLRRTYPKRLTTALAVMVAFCLLATLIIRLSVPQDTDKPLFEVSDPINLKKIESNEKPVTPPPVIKPKEIKPLQVATIKVTTPKIVSDNQVMTPPPTQDDMDGLKIDVKTTAGLPGGDMIAPPVNEGTGNDIAPVKKEDYNDVFKTVQIEAKFPGGIEGWTKYLERNLRSQTPADNGAVAGKYTVIVSFLVDKSGHISEVKADNDPGYGTAQEAVRVIQRGPDWQPAVQNGRNVIYRQKQSITFLVAAE